MNGVAHLKKLKGIAFMKNCFAPKAQMTLAALRHDACYLNQQLLTVAKHFLSKHFMTLIF